MKVKVRDGKSCEKILKVEVLPEAVQVEFDKFYRSISAKAKIPGFRPGKAPRSVLEMHYSGEARENVLKNLISESYVHALEENSLNPLGRPEIKDIKFDDKKLTYEATVEVRPVVKLSRWAGFKAKRDKVSVEPGEVEESLKHLQESLAQQKAVEDRPSRIGDILIADYTCVMDGKEVDKRAEDWFELREDEFIPGLSKQLEGLRPGDEKEVSVTFPEKMSRKDWAGKPAIFQLKVKDIKQKVLPPIDDELAKETGQCQTLDELKKKLEADLLREKGAHKEADYEKMLLDELVKHNKIDLPMQLIGRRAEHMLDEARQRMAAASGQNGDFEKNAENVKEEFAEEAKRQVHLAFLLDEIAKQQNIIVGEVDLKAKYASVAARVGQPVEAVEKYYTEHEEARDGLSDQIRNEKTIQLIKDNAKT
ncbi:MAG: trigger factor [Candidatus Omnitrophota bacterium]|nr:trigger factor [Candidatus Omnitrophota bacterium]